MDDASDRERLLSLLERLSKPTHWECWQDWWTKRDKHLDGASLFFASARRQADNGDPQQAESSRKMAKQDEDGAEKYRGLALEAGSVFAEAEMLLRKIAPHLLGGLPVDDIGVMRTNDASQLAAQCRGVLGQVLAAQPQKGNAAPVMRASKRKRARTSPTAERNRKWAEAFDADPSQYPTVSAFAKSRKKDRSTASKALKSGGSTRVKNRPQ